MTEEQEQAVLARDLNWYAHRRQHRLAKISAATAQGFSRWQAR